MRITSVPDKSEIELQHRQRVSTISTASPLYGGVVCACVCGRVRMYVLVSVRVCAVKSAPTRPPINLPCAKEEPWTEAQIWHAFIAGCPGILVFIKEEHPANGTNKNLC